ncbi:unnamed protein product [Cylicocyclus nassatus]|uniref:Uncharacterized protein n=1 Tax=Cylicocyclus nassatus TaxID=53992 RepID=A0AA36H5V6_CYLNA|nr:unnamed protein product [Cylicocyclus nassatus]
MQAAVAYLLAFILLIHSAVAWSFGREAQGGNEALDSRMNELRQIAPYRLFKRTPHIIEARGLSQFKNCYFSPIQSAAPPTTSSAALREQHKSPPSTPFLTNPHLQHQS